MTRAIKVVDVILIELPECDLIGVTQCFYVPERWKEPEGCGVEWSMIDSRPIKPVILDELSGFVEI